MNNDIPGMHSSLSAEPLGERRPPGWGSRHPVLTVALCLALGYALAHTWRLSQAYVLRTRGPQALRSYRIWQACKTAAAAGLVLTFMVSAPFADPEIMNTGEYVFSFSFVLCCIAVPAAAGPALVKALREHAWQRRQQAPAR